VVERIAGKLVGARVGEFRTVADWLSYAGRVRSVAEEKAGAMVICADYRGMQVLNKDVADAVLDGFREFNSSVYRSALMLPANAPTLRLQMERLLREAKNLRRRICSDALRFCFLSR